MSQQLGAADSLSELSHYPVQVDLALPANSRTITRLMDAWWECKVSASVCLLTLCAYQDSLQKLFSCTKPIDHAKVSN
jgi:hypothetical protein